MIEWTLLYIYMAGLVLILSAAYSEIKEKLLVEDDITLKHILREIGIRVGVSIIWPILVGIGPFWFLVETKLDKKRKLKNFKIKHSTND